MCALRSCGRRRPLLNVDRRPMTQLQDPLDVYPHPHECKLPEIALPSDGKDSPVDNPRLATGGNIVGVLSPH